MKSLAILTLFIALFSHSEKSLSAVGYPSGAYCAIGLPGYGWVSEHYFGTVSTQRQCIEKIKSYICPICVTESILRQGYAWGDWSALIWWREPLPNNVAHQANDVLVRPIVTGEPEQIVSDPIPSKSIGTPSCRIGKGIGNPCDPSTGNKYQQEIDFDGGNTGLSLIRHYNSGLSSVNHMLGYGWQHVMDVRLEITKNNITVRQADGRGENFILVNGLWQGDVDSHLTLIQSNNGYTLQNNQGISEYYDLTGRLLSKTDKHGKETRYTYNSNGFLEKITNPFGLTLSFLYNANDLLETATTPDSQEYHYEYDNKRNLTKVTYPDNSFRQYHYENTIFFHSLTGITDENGDRYATFSYDSGGKAVLTQHAQTDNDSAQEKFTLSYDSNTQTTVTDAVGTVEILTFSENLGVKNLLSRINQTDQKALVRSYDENNNLIRSIDSEGNITDFSYNSTNQQINKTEAVDTSVARMTEYQYISEQLDLVTEIRSPSVKAGLFKNTLIQYSADNTVQSITLNGFRADGTSISRSTSFQYNSSGQVTEINGPLTSVNDITTLTYYECSTGGKCGQLASISNALNQTTHYDSYDANGRITQTTSPLNLVMTYSYDLRGRLVSIAQTPVQDQGLPRTTNYSYDNAGQLKTLTTATGEVISYSYDAAHYLRRITDNLGNYIAYRYDLKGNRIADKNYDPNGILVRTQQREYNHRNHLKSINNAGSITQLVQDTVGNLVSSTDPNQNPASIHDYDPLNRLQQSIDALNNNTDYRYDINDQLIQVKASNNTTTEYLYDDLGNQLLESGADRGNIQYSYDSAGSLITRIDARGINTFYQYDLLNRVTEINYPETAENIHYEYDNCLNGIGQLCKITDQSGITQYQYDSYGNISQQLKTVQIENNTIKYQYDAVDLLSSIQYPSDRIIYYQRNSTEQIIKISTENQGVVTILADNIQYRADGLISVFNYGNGLQETRNYDNAGRLLCKQLGSLPEQCYQYDANGNILNIEKTLNNSDYQYDSLDRLLSANKNSQFFNYTLDSNGNRIEKSIDGNSESYTQGQDSNQLLNISRNSINYNYSYDASGNIIDDSIKQYVYGANNRLASVSANGITLAYYTYNAKGERVIKDNNAGIIVHYTYDLDGKIIAESDSNGNTLKEYVYANDQLIAIIQPTTVTDTETIIDNSSVSFSGSWPVSTSITGYHGNDYQFHVANDPNTGPGLLGNPIDNLQASYSDNWPISTSVNQYYTENYQFHTGTSAGLGALGSPVDNIQATYTGTWTESTSINQYYAENYQFHVAGTGLNTATWSIGVNSSVNYDVYASWSAHENRASNAKYTIHHSAGENTVTVNQQQNGGQWNFLGTYILDANSLVSLNDDANGYVIADAISILPAGTPPEITPEQVETATWDLNINNTESYDIYASWTAAANRASDAKYTINHTGGNSTVSTNQKLQGGKWNLLGTYVLDNTSTVSLSSLANGYVIADGITFLPAGSTPSISTTQADTATWVPNLSGEYEIYAKWSAYSNRASDAKYTIHHSTGDNTLTVDQQQNGGQWNLLGTYTLNTNSTVVLSNDANGYVVADGIRLVPTGTNNYQVGIFYVHNDHLGAPQEITDAQQDIVWKANYDVFGKATVTVETIVNNIRFPGQYFDQETGLHYNYYRYYDPQTGRYITSDPIGLSGGLNTYAYVGGNPLRYTDPTGEVFYPAVHGVIHLARIAAPHVARFVASKLGRAAIASAPMANVALLPSEDVPVGGVGSCSAAKSLARVPGRVQSRVNVSNSGIDHVLKTHLNPARAGNKSQFTLPESELRSLLSAKRTVQSSARALETGNFARTVTTNRTVGNLANKMGGGSTDTFTVITDKFGNLQSAFPGGL